MWHLGFNPESRSRLLNFDFITLNSHGLYSNSCANFIPFRKWMRNHQDISCTSNWWVNTRLAADYFLLWIALSFDIFCITDCASFFRQNCKNTASLFSSSSNFIKKFISFRPIVRFLDWFIQTIEIKETTNEKFQTQVLSPFFDWN